MDVHAEAEERFFYPELLKQGEGANDAEDGTVEGETEDAIEDHNKLRDAVKAVEKHKVGSKAWFDAVGEANVVNSKHMGEEERQGLTDFRMKADIAARHDLAVKFAAFEAEHITGVAGQQGPRDLYRKTRLRPGATDDAAGARSEDRSARRGGAPGGGR